MKNLLKINALAVVIISLLAACNGNGSATADSVKTDSVTKTIIDTTKKDTSAAPDSLKKDTVVKVTTTKTSSKMSVTRKN